MKYAHIDTNGKILGWYSDDIHTTKMLNVDKEVVLDKSKIPTPNIEVSENDYLKIREEKLNAYDEATETFIEKDFRTTEEIEKQRISSIKAKANELIEAIYPIYKQINITNLLIPYTEEDRDAMKAFIYSKRAICHKAIDDGTKTEDVDYSNES